METATQTKLTNWTFEPTLADMQSELSKASSIHQNYVAKLRRWEDALKGTRPKSSQSNRSNVQPKLIKKQAEWRYPQLSEPLLSSKNLFTVNPVSFEDTDAAKQNELLLNYQFRNKINRVKFVDELVHSLVDEGTAIVRIGWKRRTTLVTELTPVYDFYAVNTQEQLTQLQQAIELFNSNPSEFEALPEELKQAVNYYNETGTVSVCRAIGHVEEQIEKVIENAPEVDVLNPRNVYIDPTCNGDISKAMFIITSREVNKAGLLKDKVRYSRLDTVNWDSLPAASTDANHVSNSDASFTFTDSARKKVVVYEYWGFYDIDGKGALTPIFAAWVGNTLIHLGESPFNSLTLPFEVITYSHVKREVYGEPDAELLLDNQAITGAVTRGIIDLLGRSANSQRGMAKGLLDPVNKRRYESGLDYEFNPMMTPTAGIIEHKYPEIPSSALTVLQLQEADSEALTGIKSFGGGIQGNTYGNVATGIRGTLDAVGERKMAILRRLVHGVIEIGKRIVAMNAEFLEDEEVIRVTNDRFIKISRESLAGQFDLDIDIATTEVDNAKVQDLAFLLQTIGNKMDSSITLLILGEIARLKKMPELANKLLNFKPEPDPMTEQLQQLELQKAQLELERIQSEIELNRANAGMKTAMGNNTNLITQEKATGVTHERDLEKQSAQAKANQNLAITKALTKSRKPDENLNIEEAIGFNELTRHT